MHHEDHNNSAAESSPETGRCKTDGIGGTEHHHEIGTVGCNETGVIFVDPKAETVCGKVPYPFYLIKKVSGGIGKRRIPQKTLNGFGTGLIPEEQGRLFYAIAAKSWDGNTPNQTQMQ